MNIDRRTAKAELALSNLKYLVAQAKEHINQEFVRSDGAASSTTLAASSWIDDKGVTHTVGGGGSRSSDTTSPTERTVLARADLLEKMMEINDDLDAIINIIRSCEKTCRKAIGTRVPLPVPQCTANPGWDGYALPMSEGWHDGLCSNPARSNAAYSLCDACRKRMTRWRERNEKKELSDDRLVQFDSDYYIDDNGVAHVTPIRGAA